MATSFEVKVRKKYRCKKCGIEFIAEEDVMQCPFCGSDEVEYLGEVNVY